MGHDAELPTDEALHSQRVQALISEEIRSSGGWIGFERYMELALYAPGLGYYSAGARKLGEGGDFATAPEISRLFGVCVAKQCAEILFEFTSGSILEIGAGTGRLAVDLLARLDQLDCVPLNYLILEVSADLRDRQQRLLGECLPHLANRVTWLDTLPSTEFEGVILANEVLDALPVMRFRWHAAGPQEIGVALVDDEFAWVSRPGTAAMTAACQRLAHSADWDEGYVSEYCPRLLPWTLAIARSLRRGAILWFDYGLPRSQYYLSERHDGTLICHHRQRANDNPFLNPGLQDITAWVDFTALAEASLAAEFELAGFSTQAFFLAGLGIDREMRVLAGGDENVFARLAVQARQLMMPGEMGERFKAMAWSRGLARELSGFKLQDLRHTL